MEWLAQQNPIVQALLATCFTWLMTAAGAAVVFPAKQLSRQMLDAMLGFAAGVMIAASCWSLLIPSIEMSEGGTVPAWVPATVGFLVGAVFLRGMDRVIPHLHPGMATDQAEGVKTSSLPISGFNGPPTNFGLHGINGNRNGQVIGKFFDDRNNPLNFFIDRHRIGKWPG